MTPQELKKEAVSPSPGFFQTAFGKSYFTNLCNCQLHKLATRKVPAGGR